MRIILDTGEGFDVTAVEETIGPHIIGRWDGKDAAGLMVRFIRYREKPDELLFVRYPKTKYGAFTKGKYVTGFTVWADEALA